MLLSCEDDADWELRKKLSSRRPSTGLGSTVVLRPDRTSGGG